ncbi:hypothetical protein GCM10011390_40010 [Aureimonas endophytica]|uniref:RES domain-containing protein n=1 Tax=Aureimonas endophytica TaxID=2027858 RepID=A0A916ZWE7_9HYPH|nr:RES domain-containing protein [Aureimonas endophytica]GGE16917.1 hypothetical protein GCM10011390_40010 [Aureimonas endophytica]
MSPFAEWATIAILGYLREDGRPRVLLPLAVSKARIVDQRDEGACRALGFDRELSDQSWRPALAAGREPPSWSNSDRARAIGSDGIIDRSRHIPGGWHLTLFRWNEPGGPSVEIYGAPRPIELTEHGDKWGL